VAPTAVLAGDVALLRGRAQHATRIGDVQRERDVPGTVYGVPRGTDATTMMRGQSAWFAAHRDDVEA
jgi:hypothetical protein